MQEAAKSQTKSILARGLGGGMSTPQKRGRALEARVAKIARRSGKPAVQRNVFLTDRHGNRSEIDVAYGRWPFRRYIECKAYSKGNSVPLQDVAKFKEVLRLNNIPARHGIVVTTSTFTPRCKHVGVVLVDGVALRAWEHGALRRMLLRRSLAAAAACGVAALWWYDTYDVSVASKKAVGDVRNIFRRVRGWL